MPFVLPSATRAAVPSCGLTPFRVYSRTLCSFISRCEHLSWDSSPLGAFVPKESTFPRHPTPWFVPRSGFLTLCVVYSSFGLAGLFHPANALRLSLQGFPLPRSFFPTLRWDVPSCRFSAVALPPSRKVGPTAHCPPGSRFWREVPLADFTALLSLRVRFERLCYSHESSTDPLLGFFSPGFSPTLAMWQLVTTTPPVCLSPAPLQSCPCSKVR